MVNINISISDELHKNIKIDSTINDLSLKDYIIDILDDEIKNIKI